MTATPAKLLTPRQREVLDYIRSFIYANHYAPTMENIGDALSISKVSAFEHVHNLADKGWITRDRYKSNSIRIVEVCPRCGARTEAGGKCE